MKPNLLQLKNPKPSTPNLVAMIDIFDARDATKVTTEPRLGLAIPEVTIDELQRHALEKAKKLSAGDGAGHGEGAMKAARKHGDLQLAKAGKNLFDQQ